MTAVVLTAKNFQISKQSSIQCRLDTHPQDSKTNILQIPVISICI